VGRRYVPSNVRGSLMLCPPNFCMTLNQPSVIKYSSFIFLLPEVSDYKPGVNGRGGHVLIWLYSPNNLKILLDTAFVPPNFCMTQS